MTEAYASPELRVAVSGDDAETHLLALRDWLDQEDALRGQLDLVRHLPEPGHMGAGFDVLVVALGSGGAGAVLARSVSTWLIQRRADVKITMTARDGRRVEVNVVRAADPVRIIGEVAALLDEPAG